MTYGPIAASVAFVMELTLVPLLLPAIQLEFGLSAGELAWAFNSYGIAVAIGVLLGGWLGDIFGARGVFCVGALLFSLGSALVAIAGSYEVLILGRILQGSGGGIFSPLVPILLTLASPDRPGRILVIWGSIVGYVAAFAPVIYSNSVVAGSWHIAFLLFALVSSLALLIVLRSDSGAMKRTRAESGKNYFDVLRSRGLWLTFVYVFCTYGAITFYLFKLPVLLADRGFEVTSIGLILSILWLSFSIVNTLLRNWVDAPSIRAILFSAPIFIALGFLLAYYFPQVASLALASILVGCGLACSNAPSTQLVLELAPAGMTAISASLDITFARLGGVMTVGLLANSVFGQSALVISMLSVVAIVSAWMVIRGLEKRT